MPSGGEKHIMLYDRIALEKHFYVATKAERIQSTGCSREIQKDLSHHSINDPTFLKRKENAND